MNDIKKYKDANRKFYNWRKIEEFKLHKHRMISKKEATKIYLQLVKDHAKTLNQKIPIELNGKQYFVYPNGRIYIDKRLTDF